MKNKNDYFGDISQYELLSMFRESEHTINKTGMFSEQGILQNHFIEWSKKRAQPTPIIFLMEMYYELCKKLTMELPF